MIERYEVMVKEGAKCQLRLTVTVPLGDKSKETWNDSTKLVVNYFSVKLWIAM